MSDPLYRAERCRGLAQKCQPWSSTSPNAPSGSGNFGARGAATKATPSQLDLSQLCDFRSFLPRISRAPARLGHLLQLEGLIGFAGLCGIGFCVGAGAALYVKNSHFWTSEANALAASENKAQVVNRSRKGDRFPVRMIEPLTRAADSRDRFGTLEVRGRLNATIRIRDANGRPVFELDPLRRTTVISKREARGVPPSKEQGRQMAPKSRDAPESPVNCDPPRSRLAGSGLLQLVEECRSRIQTGGERLANLSSPPG